MSRNIYTDIETEKMINELQKDKDFNLSQLVKIAILQYYNRDRDKTQELEFKLNKAKAEAEAKNKEAEMLQQQLSAQALSKIKQEEEDRREKIVNLEKWTNYALERIEKFFIATKPEAKALAEEWAVLVDKTGPLNAPALFSFLEGKNVLKKDLIVIQSKGGES